MLFLRPTSEVLQCILLPQQQRPLSFLLQPTDIAQCSKKSQNTVAHTHRITHSTNGVQKSLSWNYNEVNKLIIARMNLSYLLRASYAPGTAASSNCIIINLQEYQNLYVNVNLVYPLTYLVSMTSELNHASAHVPQLQLKSEAAGVRTSFLASTSVQEYTASPLAVMALMSARCSGLPHLELQETGNPPSKLRSVSFGRMRGAIKRAFGGLHLS